MSRHPLSDIEVVDLMGVPMLVATMHQSGELLTVATVHTLPPRSREVHSRWREQMRALAVLTTNTSGPLILAGDLNASPQTREYSALIKAGLESAHDHVGRPFAMTFPNGMFPLPPARLDHVLVANGPLSRSVKEIHATGSDHSTLVVDLSLPEVPTTP